MIFNGMFNELTVPQAVALMSCFCFDEKTNDMPKLRDELSGALRQMQVRGSGVGLEGVGAWEVLIREGRVGKECLPWVDDHS